MIQNDIEGGGGGGGKKVQETTGETKQLRRIGQKDHKDSDVCVTQDMVDHNSLILSDNTSRALDGNQILSVNTSRELLILLRVVKEAVVREVRPRRSQGQASAQCLEEPSHGGQVGVPLGGSACEQWKSRQILLVG